MKRTLIIAAMTASLTACIIPGHHIGGHHGNPPPHAPAHGARMHHHGMDLNLDPVLGVYRVAGRAGHYFHDDYYWRLMDGLWHRSVLIAGPWIVVDNPRFIPPGLAKKFGHGKAKDHKKEKGKDKEKHKEKKKDH